MSKDPTPGGAARFGVDTATAGMRLDAFVGQRLGTSAAGGRRLIAAGAVQIDGRRAVKGARVVAGAVVEVAPHADRAAPVEPDRTLEVRVIHEDEDLVAIDKPAGMPSHPLRPHERGTAANAIVARCPGCAEASQDPREGGLGHRLDTATSGVLIAARSRIAWRGLRRALAAEFCEKSYLCEVWGAPPDVGAVNADIGRRGRRGRVVRTDGGRHRRPAETRWTVIARGPRTALLEARLHAGRPHQVRAHMAAAGFPIVGDDRYGAVDAVPVAAATVDQKTTSVLHLHAASVRLVHPITNASLLIEAPVPAWAVRFPRAV